MTTILTSALILLVFSTGTLSIGNIVIHWKSLISKLFDKYSLKSFFIGTKKEYLDFIQNEIKRLTDFKE